MKLVSASLTLLMAAAALAKDDGYPHPPAPEWVASDDPRLDRLFLKTVGDRLSRVKWTEVGFRRSEKAPLETRRDGVLAVSVGKKIAPRVTRACWRYFFLVSDDPKHWFPEDPSHWMKPEQFPTWEGLIVDPPENPGGVAKFPDLIRRVYGGPMFVRGEVSPGEVVEIVDRFWSELVAQSTTPEFDKDSATSVWLNRDGTPMWQELNGITFEENRGRRLATLHLQISPDDDTEGFTFYFQKNARGWKPTTEISSFTAAD